jgi:hypothetical protein
MTSFAVLMDETDIEVSRVELKRFANSSFGILLFGVGKLIPRTMPCLLT